MKRGSRLAQSWLKVQRREPDGGMSSRASESNRDDQDVRPTEVLASIRPTAQESTERYRVRDLVVDVGAGLVKRGDQPLALPPLSFELLVALIRRAPQTVRRHELMEMVWPNEFVNDDTLSQRAWLLREALGDLEDEPRYIGSVRGWGYKLVAKVERVEDQAPIRALAVLPLASLTGDPQQDYFADGMTETLISQLAGIRSLKVISRTSAMHYKHAEKRLPQIARELAVDAVVEGTVLVAGGRVRVSVQLIRAETDEHLWAGTYDRNIEDVFALHSDLARSIASEIRALVTPEEQVRLEKNPRVNAAAHDSDLRARYFLGKLTPPDLEQAITDFEKAIACDSSFARAYAGLAITCFARAVPLGSDLSVSDQRKLLDRAKAAAKGALSIDRTLAEAYAALGITLLFHDWDWHGAEKALESALELAPNSSVGHLFRAVLASTTADGQRTRAEMRRAVELDPLNLLCIAECAECCFWIRDYAQAVAYASQAIELDPSFPRAHFVLGRVHEAEGKIAEAIAEYQRAGVIEAGTKGAQRAFQRGGATGYHRWALRVGITAAPYKAGTFHERPFFTALSHSRLGEVDEAMRCLEQAYHQRECLLVLLKAQEWWDALRADGRFADLVRRVGIP